MKLSLQSLQPLGRALMLPIAVLPVAALLLRLGQPDLLDRVFAFAFDVLGLVTIDLRIRASGPEAES